MVEPRKRNKTDYEKPKQQSFKEVRTLTTPDPELAGATIADNVVLPIASQYRIEMMHPAHGVTLSGPGPRGPNPGDPVEEWRFQKGTVKVTPSYLSPEEAQKLAMHYIRDKTRLAVPVIVAGKREEKTSQIKVHTFDVKEVVRLSA
jgi:hypothetical protein